MKFNGQLSFAVAGVGERYVLMFLLGNCTFLYNEEKFLLCIAIVISENRCVQAIYRHNLYVAKMSIICRSKPLQIHMSLTYKSCNEERSAKIPCGISSIMLFDKFLQQIKIRHLH